MDWPESLSDLFPEPRPDEPARLRQDITDELADHLACALDRQRPLSADDTAAKEAVLARFGNPQTIARRLWFDAMQEKIMSQRITLAFVTLLVVACLSSTGLAWMLYRDGQLLNQESRAINQAILARLTTLEAPSDEQPQEDAPLSLEWAKLQIRLVQEKKGGQPAAGFTARLGGNPINPAQELQLMEESDEEGLIKFGPVRPGAYWLGVTSPWGHMYMHDGQKSSLVLLPGKTTEIEILCPSRSADASEVAFRIDWPEEIADKKPLLLCSFSVQPRHTAYNFDADRWRLTMRDFEVTLNREGKVLENYSRLPVLQGTSQPWDSMLRAPMPQQPMSWSTNEGNVYADFYADQIILSPSNSPAGPRVFFVAMNLDPRATIQTDVRHYQLSSMGVFLLDDYDEVPQGQRAYKLKLVNLSDEPGKPTFQAIPGELNTWHIKLPEILMDETSEKPKSVGYLPESSRQR